jgi:hypothetical protein
MTKLRVWCLHRYLVLGSIGQKEPMRGCFMVDTGGMSDQIIQNWRLVSIGQKQPMRDLCGWYRMWIFVESNEPI